MPEHEIPPLSRDKEAELQRRIEAKTKPPGSLGRLEEMALKIGLIQDSTEPTLGFPAVLVFAGDHGIVEEGVSAYPQEVTAQMVLNFLRGGAAINVFARQHGIHLEVIDAGVNADLPSLPGLVDAKIAPGTRNFLEEPAMSADQLRRALEGGAERVRALRAKGCDVVGFGEMGIGNTSSAAMIMSHICRLPLSVCVGAGTGLDDQGLARKRTILEEAARRHPADLPPLEVLRHFGGFEIAMMCGGMMEAARLRMVVLVDGFIATAAVLVAAALHEHFLDYCIFTHLSEESGHQKMLETLGATPLLRLGLRLGEGTGCALAYPLLQSAVRFLAEMATFESAHVSEKRE